ncbi:ROK family protein [Microlunatus sp. GCM10028923]|uniref:ROK family protein n=1 Tax=Microlunatus sp. GCM10028923 TaxID=3273400 RepID=UPI00360B7D54
MTEAPKPIGTVTLSAAGRPGKPARQGSLRESNLALVAGMIFDRGEPLSRSQIADHSGLNRGTVSRIVDQLVGSGIVAEREPLGGTGAGRPVIPLEPAANSRVALGFEVNTASAGACLVDLAGNVISERVITGDFIDSNPRAVLGRLSRIGDTLLDRAEAIGARYVGSHLALPGVIDRAGESLIIAPRLGWSDLDPRRLFRSPRLAARPMQLGGVLPFAALAEASLRRDAATRPSFLYVAGDNSIGSALVINGESFTDLYGGDSTIGHILIDSRGPECWCGRRGCLEQYVSRQAILDRAGLEAGLPVEQMAELAVDHAPLRRVLRRTGSALGAALATLTNFVEVPTIVLGDNLAVLLPIMEDEITAELTDRILRPEVPTVEPARSGPHAAMRGGALSVLRKALDNLQDWL